METTMAKTENTMDLPMASSVVSFDSNNEIETSPFIQMNGRKVLGPPENWTGPPPSNACELYIRKIPKHLSEHVLISSFLRIGKIYEIRIPIEYNNYNRGYAYVKYTNEEDAACAIEVLNHYFISRGRKFEISYSYEKSRLFVTNVPKNLTEEEVESEFRTFFPTMQRISFRNASEMYSGMHKSNNNENIPDIANRGHVFVHFATHADALAAKRSVSPGIIRVWNRDLKVVWAESDRNVNVSPTTKTIFMRHVDFAVNKKEIIELLSTHVQRTAIQKVSKVRNTAFIEFDTREAAEICLRQLQGINLHGYRLELEWARPSEKQSLHRMRNIDFDAMLRLKCIANCWSIPIILFGTYFPTERLQYAIVILRDKKHNVRAIYCIIECKELADIHSRLCEVVCALIETIGTFPDYNYMFLLEKENAHLLGMVMHNEQQVEFIAADGVPQDFNFDLNEIIDLSYATMMLTNMDEELLLKIYHESFRTSNLTNFLPYLLVYGHRIFGTILPKYRNKAPLNYHLNDTQIVLALCYLSTASNLAIPSRPFVPFLMSCFETDSRVIKYVKLKLLPLAITQYNCVTSQLMGHIVYGKNKFYHPAQRAILPPIWINGCTYAKSIKQPRQFEFQPNYYLGSHHDQNQMFPTTTTTEQMSTSASGAFCPLYQSASTSNVNLNMVQPQSSMQNFSS